MRHAIWVKTTAEPRYRLVENGETIGEVHAGIASFPEGGLLESCKIPHVAQDWVEQAAARAGVVVIGSVDLSEDVIETLFPTLEKRS